LGGRLRRVEPGRVEIELDCSDPVTQQNGYFHAAAITAIADSAKGYAALRLMYPEEDVLAVEFKVNLLRRATGRRLFADATVLRSGRTLVVSHIAVSSTNGEHSQVVAVMLQTNIRVGLERRRTTADAEVQ
jgi:uncharacterized protein (TIGR00369 family)